eukprot:TRINITY_DN20903_c0_g3_i1.p1 TRINITY_DN20903_c0_g3~~TRINITY_DN20903_c0_g3_i1.p1  ORF type:complete len:212 (-),score=71.17 TRINITY_DN20903_c0_g3_i1:77-712(-)
MLVLFTVYDSDASGDLLFPENSVRAQFYLQNVVSAKELQHIVSLVNDEIFDLGILSWRKFFLCVVASLNALFAALLFIVGFAVGTSSGFWILLCLLFVLNVGMMNWFGSVNHDLLKKLDKYVSRVSKQFKSSNGVTLKLSEQLLSLNLQVCVMYHSESSDYEDEDLENQFGNFDEDGCFSTYGSMGVSTPVLTKGSLNGVEAHPSFAQIVG